MTGFHSVIDSPDWVSRVAPPTTTMAKMQPATTQSHARTGASKSARRPAKGLDVGRSGTESRASRACEIDMGRLTPDGIVPGMW